MRSTIRTKLNIPWSRQKTPLEAHLGQILGPSSTKLGPKLDQVGGKLGQDAAKLGQVGGKLSQVGAKMGQVGGKMALFWPTWCQNVPKMACLEFTWRAFGSNLGDVFVGSWE